MSNTNETKNTGSNSLVQTLLKYKFIIIGILAAMFLFFIAAVIGIVALFSYKKTVKIDEYVTVSASGYDGFGNASIYVDWAGLVEDYEKSIRYTSLAKKEFGKDYCNAIPAANFLASYITLELNKSSEIANGDVLSYEVIVDDALEDYLKCKISTSNPETTISELELIKKFNPFDDISVTFDGISPNGSARYEYSGGDFSYYDFSLNNYSNLKNDDVITLTLNVNQENYARNYGKYPEITTMDYTVEGLREYILNANDIPEQKLNEFKSAAEDTVLAYIANDYSEKSSLSNLTYEGYIFASKKASVDYLSRTNMLYVIYSGIASNSDGKFHNTKVYFPVRYTNLITGDDGLEFEKDGISGSSYFGNSWYSTKGYIHPVVAYNDLVTKNIENYDYAISGSFENYDEVVQIDSISDIEDTYKEVLFADAINRVETYIASDFNEKWVVSGLGRMGEYFLVNKSPSYDRNNNILYVVVALNVSNFSSRNSGSVTIYMPVRYEGIVRLKDGQYFYTNCAGISGYASLPNSYYSVYGYNDGQNMFTKLVTANRDNYTYEVSEGLVQFGE